MRALFILAIFLGSGLLFLVQPMVAKMILPTFGGSPQVWNTSMVFFQAALLLGYLYAHLSPKLFGKWQPFVHVALMALIAFTLPFTTRSDFFASIQARMSGQAGVSPEPTLWVLVSLFALVGLPFLLLSSGAPLLQRWFSRTRDPQARDPFFLYSSSNLGSMIALLAYPVLMEPTLRLGEQSRTWTWGYYALALAMAACAAITLRQRTPEHERLVESEPERNVSREDRILWLLLAAVPSSLLLGLTTFITVNVAPVPLLWVIPLAIYLLTFILAFARKNLTNINLLGRLLPILATPLAVVIILENLPPEYMIPLAVMHLFTFFVAAWMCHGRLNESRPGPKHLTEFYLWISIGGVLGGIFNAILAPLLFNTLLEYPIALVAACLLRPRIAPNGSKTQIDWLYPAAVAGVAITLLVATRLAGMGPSQGRTAITIGIPLVMAFFAVDRPLRFGLSLAAVFLVARFYNIAAMGTVAATERSFFGVHRVLVSDTGRYARLVHGTTVHGMQDRENPGEPLTYYHRGSPIGQVMEEFAKDKDRIALVGLGVGTLAAYGQPGQELVYYEIDPVVEKLARDSRFFTFLDNSKADVKVVLGDARLSLAKEPDASFDLIVLDAFSSDTIPVHLLTVEATRLYLDKLAPGGILAFHISNQYLELEPVVGAVANKLGLAWTWRNATAGQDDEDAGFYPSKWLLMARDEETLARFDDITWFRDPVDPDVKPWTDDYSNVLGAFQ